MIKYLILLALSISCTTTSLREGHKKQLLEIYSEEHAEDILYIWDKMKIRFKCEEFEDLKTSVQKCMASSKEAYKFWINCSFRDCK